MSAPVERETSVAARPHVVTDFVRWADIDYARIMRYSAFPRFFELGEAELFRSLGVPYHELFTRFGVSLPRRVMHLDFHAPARLDDQLEIRTYVSDVGSSALTLNIDVVHAESRAWCATGWLVLVCTEVEELKKQPLPGALLEILAPHRLGLAEAREGLPPLREPARR